jgi:1,4-dihydroxy-2-naphthoate octaprenyltransferase
MKKITKRDLLFFVLGLLAMLMFELLYNWTDHVKDFKDGYNDATKTENIKTK